MDERALVELHEWVRSHPSRTLWLYKLLRRAVPPLFTVLFRPEVRFDPGAAFPREGAFIVVANHRSFFDSLAKAVVCPRPVRWMGKAELFDSPLKAWVMVRCGAFPVRRGQSDELALETARVLLRTGNPIGLFPEGTRVRSDEPADAKTGAARLAVECQVPVIPMSMVGTERGAMRKAPFHQGHRVRMIVHPAQMPDPVHPDADPQTLRGRARDLTDRVWPHVRRGVHQLEHDRRAHVAFGALASVATVRKLRRNKRVQP